jgi:hypothetical protein
MRIKKRGKPMKFNFKFLAFALTATMLCFSFGCAPTSSAAASVPIVEKHSVKRSIGASVGQIEEMNLIEPNRKVCNGCGDVFQTHSVTVAVCQDCSAKMSERIYFQTDTIRRTAPNLTGNTKPEQTAFNAKPEIIPLC